MGTIDPLLMEKRLKQLSELNSLLKRPNELPGLFLPKDATPQFNFMSAGEMPSMNEPRLPTNGENFNFDVTMRDKFLQEVMRKYGAAGSYVT